MLSSELHDSRLSDILGRLETQLSNRLPTLNHVLAQINVSLSDVTAALIAENAVMAQAGQSASNTIVGRGAPGGGADADGLALAHQSYISPSRTWSSLSGALTSRPRWASETALPLS